MRAGSKLGWVLAVAFGLSAAPALAQQLVSCKKCPGKVWFVDAGSTAGSPDGTSWPTAYRRVQQALAAAKDGDCIWVAAGRYFTSAKGLRSESFDIDKSIRMYGGFAGYENCLDARAGLFSATHLSGEIGNPSLVSDNAFTVVDISGVVAVGQPAPRVLIDGFVIQGAYDPGGLGGGIYLTDHTLELRNCTVRDNRSGSGGGLFAMGCSLDLARCSLVANEARDGAGLWLGGVSSGVAPLLGGANVHNTLFKNNSATRRGGGVYLADSSLTGVHPVQFVNALFRGNEARQGGAGYLEEAMSTGSYFQPARAFLANCTIADNRATATGPVKGAAFVVEEQLAAVSQNAVLDLINCVLWGNAPTSAQSPALEGTPNQSLLAAYTIVDAGSPLQCNPAPACTNGTGNGGVLCTVFDCNPLFLAGLPYHPDPNGPAIDNGFWWIPPDVLDLDSDNDVLEPTPVDLDGLPRASGVPDRGAYEAP